jgi:hypothetical protein
VKLSARIPALLKMALWIILVISLTACASGPDDEPASISPPEDQENFEYHIPRLLGFIVDPAGEPVVYAEVGGEDIATEDGVASGDFLDYEGGWIPVTALGYASGYAKAFAADQGFPFFVTTLTPYQSVRKVEDGNPLALHGFYQEEVYLSAEITSELFQESSVMVGLAVIDRYSVSPVLAPYPDGEGLWLRSAFAMEAFDEEWNPAQLKSGAAIPVTLEMASPLSDQAAFARFDMDSGEWQTVDLGCEKGEGNLYTCHLDTLDPLIGIFDQPVTFTSGVTHSPREGAAALSSGNTPKEDYQQALNDLTDWINSQQDNPDGINNDNPDLIKLVDALKKVAIDYAKNNRNEDGKKMLIEALGKAQETGQFDSADELLDETEGISNELGKDALKESDCGEFRRLLKAAGQIQMTGGDMALADQLINKVKSMAADCDVWTGTIHVMLFVSPVHASGLSQTQGIGTWTERHNVKISTNVETHEMFGEDWVSLNFGEVTYAKEKPCPREIKMSGSGGDNLITIEGFYDGYNFTVTLISPQGTGGSVTQSWEVQTKTDGECITTFLKKFSFAPFHSFLTHGVSGEEPLLTYVEILDTTNLRAGPDWDTLRGSEDISNLDPEMGIYPVERGTVGWSFVHAIKKLPLKDEK